MTARGRIRIIVASMLLFALAMSSAADDAVSRARATHRIAWQTEREVRVEFRFPAPSLEVRSGLATPRIAGAGQAWRHGSPQLPEYSVVLVVPPGTRPALTITGSESYPLRLQGEPAIVDTTIEPGRSTLRRTRGGEAENLATRERATLEDLGVARDVHLARLTVYPVRYDGRWETLESLEATVRFEPVGEPAFVSESASSSSIPLPRPSTIPALKIRIREDGLYAVTHADLVASGVDPAGVDPATFVVTHRGEEVALDVTGAADGSFDPGDAFRFFGRALGGDESWDSVYRLTGGYESGLRVAELDVAPVPTDPPATHFDNQIWKEVDLLYYASVPESSPTPWLWESLAVTTPGVPVYTEKVVTLENVSASPGTGRLEVRVQSRRETPGPSPNHHVRTYLNGNLVADQSWTGLQSVTLAGEFPQSWLLEGPNVIRIENPSDLGLTVQTEYTDWIRLTYEDSYRAEGDYLDFGAEDGGPWRFTVSGFSGPDVVLYDVGDPLAPVRLTGAEVGPPACVDCMVTFSHQPSTSPARMIALAPGAARAPDGFEIDTPSDLRTLAPTGADMLIVAHDDFVDAIAPLGALRQSQGLRVVTASLTDVYDEFNGGIAETQGIKNFVRWAFENYAPPAPLYLLLVGDATFDPKDHKGDGDNYVPTRMTYAGGFGYVPSETWFTAVAGEDDVPDLAGGRIAARSVEQVESYVANLLASENNPDVAALNSGLLYVTDDDDPQFETVTENLIARFHPPAMDVRRVYLQDYPRTSGGVGDARDAVAGALDTGSLLSIFFGHGGRTEWAQENLWRLDDVSALQATGRYSFVLALNCVNALYNNLDSEPHSLGEWWNLVPDRGAVASWAPSALGTLFNYQVLADRLYEEIFVEKETTAGVAAWRALVDAYVTDNIDVLNVRDMVYFGDPAARLPLDSDRDGLLERDEIASGGDPDDADTDDDGLTDDQEPSWDSDHDLDGQINAADPDADDDGLPDGLETGVTTPHPATDPSSGHFLPDTHPGSTTESLDPDTDGGGAPDGAEDRNRNGAVDEGETDPNDPADDPACAPGLPPETSGLVLGKDGGVVVLSWDDTSDDDPCALYRVYAAMGEAAPAGPSSFVQLGVATVAEWRLPPPAEGDGTAYFLVRTTASSGDGPLGHFGE